MHLNYEEHETGNMKLKLVCIDPVVFLVAYHTIDQFLLLKFHAETFWLRNVFSGILKL